MYTLLSFRGKSCLFLCILNAFLSWLDRDDSVVNLSIQVYSSGLHPYPNELETGSAPQDQPASQYPSCTTSQTWELTCDSTAHWLEAMPKPAGLQSMQLHGWGRNMLCHQERSCSVSRASSMNCREQLQLGALYQRPLELRQRAGLCPPTPAAVHLCSNTTYAQNSETQEGTSPGWFSWPTFER